VTRRVAVTFDNLGEASKIEQGAWPPGPAARAASVGGAGVAAGARCWTTSARGRRGVPTLTEAEGLRAEQLPADDAVLKAWVVGAAAALARETGPGG
jgi:hypothetical protein